MLFIDLSLHQYINNFILNNSTLISGKPMIYEDRRALLLGYHGYQDIFAPWTFQQAQDVNPVLFFCATVCDAGPTLKHHRVTFPCLMGYKVVGTPALAWPLISNMFSGEGRPNMPRGIQHSHNMLTLWTLCRL